jgi:hypothetical protein
MTDIGYDQTFNDPKTTGPGQICLAAKEIGLIGREIGGF